MGNNKENMIMKVNEYTRNYFKIIIAVVTICLFIIGCSKGIDPSAKYNGIIDVNDENFEEVVLHSELPVLVCFYGAGCQPCWQEMPRVRKIANRAKGKLKVCKIESTTVYVLQSQGIPNPIVSKRYRLGCLPIVIVFNDGREVVRDFNGVHPDLYYMDINPVLERLTGERY